MTVDVMHILKQFRIQILEAWRERLAQSINVYDFLWEEGMSHLQTVTSPTAGATAPRLESPLETGADRCVTSPLRSLWRPSGPRF